MNILGGMHSKRLCMFVDTEDFLSYLWVMDEKSRQAQCYFFREASIISLLE